MPNAPEPLRVHAARHDLPVPRVHLARALLLLAGILATLTAVLLAVLPEAAAGQVSSRGEILDEIRSLDVQVDVTGGEGLPPGLAQELERVVVRELERTGILRELATPRPGDCCLLRVDARLAASRGVLRLGSGYTVRLDLGVHERVGRHEGWLLLWQSPVLSGVVDPRELPEILRTQVLELAIGFTDQYRVRFPPR